MTRLINVDSFESLHHLEVTQIPVLKTTFAKQAEQESKSKSKPNLVFRIILQVGIKVQVSKILKLNKSEG